MGTSSQHYREGAMVDHADIVVSSNMIPNFSVDLSANAIILSIPIPILTLAISRLFQYN